MVPTGWLPSTCTPCGIALVQGVRAELRCLRCSSEYSLEQTRRDLNWLRKSLRKYFGVSEPLDEEESVSNRGNKFRRLCVVGVSDASLSFLVFSDHLVSFFLH